MVWKMKERWFIEERTMNGKFGESIPSWNKFELNLKTILKQRDKCKNQKEKVWLKDKRWTTLIN